MSSLFQCSWRLFILFLPTILNTCSQSVLLWKMTSTDFISVVISGYFFFLDIMSSISPISCHCLSMRTPSCSGCLCRSDRDWTLTEANPYIQIELDQSAWQSTLQTQTSHSTRLWYLQLWSWQGAHHEKDNVCCSCCVEFLYTFVETCCVEFVLVFIEESLTYPIWMSLFFVDWFVIRPVFSHHFKGNCTWFYELCQQSSQLAQQDVMNVVYLGFIPLQYLSHANENVKDQWSNLNNVQLKTN